MAKRTSLKPALSEVIKLFKRHHLSYDQIHYIVKMARQKLNLIPKETKFRKIDRLSSQEQKKLITAAYHRNGFSGLIVKTLFLTGARVSEFVEIKVGDFYFHEKIIVIKKGKNKKSRTVPITSDLAQELKTYINKRSSGYLFESTRNSKFTTRRIQQIVKQIAKEAKIKKKVYPHLLRHSVATFLLEHGMPLEQIQKFLGHEKIETTQIYAKNSAEQIREEFKKAMGKLDL